LVDTKEIFCFVVGGVCLFFVCLFVFVGLPRWEKRTERALGRAQRRGGGVADEENARAFGLELPLFEGVQPSLGGFKTQRGGLTFLLQCSV
jgi:hypothetical protein